MKSFIASAGFLFLCIFISGCELLCQAGTGTCGLSSEKIEKLLHPKPYLQNWNKSGITSDARRQDAFNCGGGRGIASKESACWATSSCPDMGDSVPIFSLKKINETRQASESEYDARVRLRHDWERCMIKIGYHYTGECYDNEISKAKPACGAP